jgi:hypothetical protein
MKARIALMVLALSPIAVLGHAEQTPPKNQDVCSTPESQLEPTQVTQLQPLCEAARKAEKAAKNQQILAGIQAAVTATCTAACLAAHNIGPVANGWCTTAASGAGAYSFIKAKEVLEKIMALTGPAIMVAGGGESAFDFKTVGDKPGADGKPPAKTQSKASCFTAALSAVSTYMSYDGAKQSKETAKQNRKAANSLRGSMRSNISLASVSAAGGQQISGSTGGNAQAKLAGRKALDSDSSGGGLDPCDGPSSFGANVSCALSQPGNQLPPFVSSPDFQDVLEKLSGVSGDRLMGLNNPQSIMQAALGRTLTPQGQDQFASILKDVEASIGQSEAASAYAGGGGGRKSGGDSGLPDINSFIDKLIPGEGQTDAAANGVNEVEFGPGREIASRAGDEEDRRVSLFSRVSGRYRLTVSRVNSRAIEMEQRRLEQARPRTAQ